MTLFYCRLPERGLIALSGEESRKFLQGLVSNDAEKVTAESAIYAALLTAQGKFLHDFFILEAGGGLLLDCERERLADLLRRLTLYRLRAKVQLRDATDEAGVFALFGEGAAASLGLPPSPGAAAGLGGGVAFVDPRNQALGVRIVAAPGPALQALQATGAREVSAEAWQRHRLALGVPDGSRDLQVEKSFLLEHNFEELNGVDFRKGCYVGQELTARTKYRGLIKKRLFQVEADGPLPAPGTPVMRGDHEAGTVYSSLDGRGLALLRLVDVAAAAASGEPLVAGGQPIRPIRPAYAAFEVKAD